jgi:hypothetical protein
MKVTKLEQSLLSQGSMVFAGCELPAPDAAAFPTTADRPRRTARHKNRGSVRIEQNELVALVRKQGGSVLVAKPLTPGQLRAPHAKASSLDAQHKQPQRTAKRWALNRASDRFGRPIVSANDLGEVEASWVPPVGEGRALGNSPRVERSRASTSPRRAPRPPLPGGAIAPPGGKVARGAPGAGNSQDPPGAGRPPAAPLRCRASRDPRLEGRFGPCLAGQQTRCLARRARGMACALQPPAARNPAFRPRAKSRN